MGATLTILGLAVATVAAALMYYFPARVTNFTKEGQREIAWAGPASEQGKKAYRRQTILSKLGPGLLIIGFLLQLSGGIFQANGN